MLDKSHSGQSPTANGHTVPTTLAQMVQELQEILHVSLSNRRDDLTTLKQEFPDIIWPHDMPEVDGLWKSKEERSTSSDPDHRGKETVEEMRSRASVAWDKVFDEMGTTSCEYRVQGREVPELIDQVLLS